ncbi:uncharacterized protein LOC105703468 [Orussus abietinus]|uniref:uncharacterized protein LOC105703468 n=1 Tax=Orussus abietinus TaxID=222816 RepID=UPI000625A945|nr:uncharacterized protein LOC105703468 [Orussus abietinus]
MAYVLWRVFMKKYSKVRLGIRNLPVIPADRRVPDKEETWTLASEVREGCEDEDKDKDRDPEVPRPPKEGERSSSQSRVDGNQDSVEPNLPRSHETRKSKTKRVKNYLKKCKGALTRADDSLERKQRDEGSSWYLEDQKDSRHLRDLEVEDQVPVDVLDRREDQKGSRTSLYEDASDLSPDAGTKFQEDEPPGLSPATDRKESLETLTTEDSNLNKFDSSDTLIADVPEVPAPISGEVKSPDRLRLQVAEVLEDVEDLQGPEGNEDGEKTQGVRGPAIPPTPAVVGGRGDVATLVRNLLGPLYGEGVLHLLTRQARDILVCAYHGNLDNFLRSYLSPAATLLAEVKLTATGNGNESVVPEGWPLTLGGSGLVLQLGELEASALRLGECYLCVRNAAATAASETVERNSVEIALVWRASMRSPGILGWDREDEYMDWRERQKPPAYSDGSSTERTSGRGPRRRVREDRLVDPETGSTERQECRRSCERRDSPRSEDPEEDDAGFGEATPVEKSRSTCSVDGRRKKTSGCPDRRCRPHTRSGAQGDAATLGQDISWTDGRKVRRGAKVSSLSMEKWKEATRCELKSRSLGPGDLKTPLNLDDATAEASSEAAAAASRDEDVGHSERLRNLRPDEVNDEELPWYIGTLLVTVERMIERVSLDDLTFPCPACRNIDTDDPLLGCKCAGDTCDCGNEACYCSASEGLDSCRSFEVAGIKHIDSDDEEEVRMGFGKKRLEDIAAPRTIDEFPEHVLTCGLTLPGRVDSSGREILDFRCNTSDRKSPTVREMASYLLYLCRLPSLERTKGGFTLLVHGESPEDLETLDKVMVLLQGRVRITQILLLRNPMPEASTDQLFPRSQIKPIIVEDGDLDQHIPGSDQPHDHVHWIAFYKEYDGLMTEWQAAGRRLALEMSELKECSNLSGTLTPLNRLLEDPTLRRTSRDADEAIATLEDRAATLLHLEHVRISVERARRLVEEVGNAATRLESSFESRRATIRNLAVLRSIEDQAHEVLSWLCKKGEDILSKHGQHTATTLTTARLHEREFEKFYFTSMRHLDKGSDLAEAASARGLRELARSLKQHLRGFGSRLEDRREYLEDTSRCCLLQDRAYEWAQEAGMAGERRAQQFLMARPPLPPEHFMEMMALAEKLGNEVLLEQCRIARSKCTEALEMARSCSAPGSPARRRSFAVAESPTSWDDSLSKRTSWDESDSASYACPLESVGSGSSGRPILDNIAELRESAEQLLDCSPPRTPPRSPAPRRLVKPPVNSHLHRAPSIAPGMKAKKTILLIMREMIQTERDYVKSLEYIIENYIPELVREDIPQALRGQRNVIFGNVEKIYEFHSQHFLHELEQCEQSPMMVGQCFLRHEKKFYLYALYNKNKPNSDSLMAEYGTSFFKAKQLELGDKMDLASYLLKPVQRMGKYALLLQQLVKAGTDLSDQLASKDEKEDKEDCSKPTVEGEVDLIKAEQMVRFQLRHGNDLLAMDSLRDCDVNVKEQGRLLRQSEFLVWQGKGKKCLRQVFLFEDLILFSKARRFPDRKNLDIYIYKHSIKTTDIGLTAVIADSPTKFEIWFRKRKPGDTYTLQCATEEIKKTWTEELSRLLWKQALRNREVRLAEMSSMGIGNKPCLDIRPSADQINDRSISVAQLSKTPRFRNSIAVSVSEESSRCSRRPHSVISVSSSSSSGGSSGPPTTLHLGLDNSPRPHHRSTTLNSQCSVESGIIADISIVSDDGGDGADRSHWNSTLESPTMALPASSTPLQSPTSTSSPSDPSIGQYDQDMSINL